jgi:nucleoside 2-deoxyribosyltransferase
MTRQPRIYYAASLFNEAERAFNREVVAMIHELGYSTWFPQEDVGLLTDLVDQLGMTLEEVRDHIFALNIKEVQEADIVVFVLDGRVPDEGACIEAGIAWAMRKPIYGLKTDIRGGEPGGNNIMIDGIVNTIAESVDELRELLEPVHTVVDLTGEEPVVSIGHGHREVGRTAAKPTPPGSRE